MTPGPIINAVLASFRCSYDELHSQRRHRNEMEARLAASYLLQVEANESREAVAHRFQKSPAWVSWSKYACEALGAIDKLYAAKVAAAYNQMKGIAV